MGDGPEPREPVADRQERQAFQQNRAEAVPMQAVVDGQGYFGLARVARMVGAGGDDVQVAFLAAEGHDGQAALRIGVVAERANHLRRRGRFRKEPIPSRRR
ncbi:MAG: hypothetical protein UZ03_NOB001003076 [Nitrospira sp. OLB3]|nr:MAG: hypothetical protein UZ03_NOB001003076 [Nitrospira sp. OLB3]